MSGILVARPRKEPAGRGPSGTKHIRVHADLAEMISDLLLANPGLTSAGLCDPLLRAAIQARWATDRIRIDRIKRERQKGE